eukprot:4854754-Pyramimonas_sp.AAC.1
MGDENAFFAAGGLPDDAVLEEDGAVASTRNYSQMYDINYTSGSLDEAFSNCIPRKESPQAPE